MRTWPKPWKVRALCYVSFRWCLWRLLCVAAVGSGFYSSPGGYPSLGLPSWSCSGSFCQPFVRPISLEARPYRIPPTQGPTASPPQTIHGFPCFRSRAWIVQVIPTKCSGWCKTTLPRGGACPSSNAWRWRTSRLLRSQSSPRSPRHHCLPVRKFPSPLFPTWLASWLCHRTDAAPSILVPLVSPRRLQPPRSASSMRSRTRSTMLSTWHTWSASSGNGTVWPKMGQALPHGGLMSSRGARRIRTQSLPPLSSFAADGICDSTYRLAMD